MSVSRATNFIIPKALWILYFCYATIVALIFQKFLLPLLPSLHAGNGLLTNDAIYFHTVAKDLADQIRLNGWSNWSLYPGLGAGANVSVLSILYVFFGTDPSLAIPINAVLHASSGVLIYLIAKTIYPGNVGHYAGLIASAFFIVFPSSLNWYAQIHKDGYAILGYLLVLYSWVSWVSIENWKNKLLLFLSGNIFGGILIMSVRIYAVDVLLLAVFLLLFFVALSNITQKRGLPIIFGAAAAVIFLGALVITTHVLGFDNLANVYTSAYDENCPIVESWEWQRISFVPAKIDSLAENISALRLSLICSGYESNSVHDGFIVPDNFISLIAYLPRVSQIALFAPFPDTWLNELSITRIVGSVEIFIWYLLVPGIFLLLWQRNTLSVWLILGFGFVFLFTYGYVTANLGTLHRIRYPFLMIFMLLGLLGWLGTIFKHLNLEMFKRNMTSPKTDYRNAFKKERVKVVSAGASVICFTALSFVLFFYRDVLMGQKFGVGSELDAFFLAMLLPMFFVNVFSIPLGSSFIPVYHRLRNNSATNADSMFSTVLFFSLGSLTMVGGILLLLSNVIYPIIVSKLDVNTILRTLDLLPYCVLILVQSVVVVLANAILNARQIYSWPAIYQAAVPIFSIISLFIYGKESGIASVAVGMLFGQTINLILVLYLLYRDGVTLKINFSSRIHNESYRELYKLYVALVVAALFASATTVIDNVMASSLNAGSIGIYSLGSKVSIFATGVIGAGIASVVLPRFTTLFLNGDSEACKRDLAFFIYLGTVLTIPIALVLFSISDDVVQIVFSGELMTMHGAEEVGRVAIFGIAQLPFFVSYALLIRFANAYKKGKFIVIAASLGLILNVVLNIILMQIMGVSGLALATTLSVLVTSLILMIMAIRYGYIRVFDVLLITFSWCIYLTSVLCIHFQSYAGFAVSIIAMLVLMWEIWMAQREPSLKSKLDIPAYS